MSRLVKEPSGIRPGREAEFAEIETRKSAPAEVQTPTTNAKTFSLTRRLMGASVASQWLIAIGVVLVAVLYAKTHSAVYAGSAVLLLLLAANYYVVRSIRRGLAPLLELAERTQEISAPNWSHRASSGDKQAREILALSNSIEVISGRIKESFRQQRDFTSDAAHEWKTSVAIVKSSLQSLLHRPRTQREYQIGLEGLLEDCSRLEDLLGKMLYLGRIEQVSENGVRPELISTDLSSTCEAALSRIRKMAEERGVSLALEVSDSIILRAAPEDLELIWMNLLENAVQYSPFDSTVKMRVRKSTKSMAQISVLDSGPGIPQVELPYIFGRFRRGEASPGRPTSGFGLGLAICKALVESYGGTIEAMNRSEGGAELCVQLPVRQS